MMKSIGSEMDESMEENSAHSNPAETSSTTTTKDYNDREAKDILEAIERKRKQVDIEIARFRAQKEKELQDFEISLRKNRNLECRPQRKWDGENGIHKLKSQHPPQQRTGVGLETESDDSQTGPLLCRLDINGASAKHGSATHQDQPQGPENATPTTHDREIEFQGLFTPSYLPLLDGSKKSSIKSGGDLAENPLAPVTFESAITNSYLEHSTIPLLPTITTSPPPASSSLPQRQQFQTWTAPLRRFSTSPPRSQLAAASLPSALRSSRRSSKNSRSPKHVLFQLANAIVQPSSSYEDVKTTNRTLSQSPSRAAIMDREAMFQLPEDDNGSDINNTQPAEDRDESHHQDQEHHGTTRVMEWLGYDSDLKTTNDNLMPATPTGGPTHTPRYVPNPSNEDSMFALDEEMDGMAQSAEDGGEEEEEDKELEEDTVIDEEHLSPTSQVGSLPIDIVRPTPTDPRNE